MTISSMLIAIVVMAIATFCLRVTPFLLSERSPLLQLFNGENRAINALGPMLLAILAVITLVPAVASSSLPHDGAYLAGTVATVVLLTTTRNTGLAIIAGITAYGVVLQLAV